MKTLKPITLDEKEIIKVAENIIFYVKDTFYNKLAEIYKGETNNNLFENAISSYVMEALKKGLIYVEGHYIYGAFNSKLIKELEKMGGVVKYRAVYFKELPIEITNFINKSSYKTKNIIGEVNDFLDIYLKNLEESIKYLDISYSDTVENYHEQLINNLKKLSIVPKLSQYQIQDINENYIFDTKKSIVKFLDYEVVKLRKQMVDYVLNEGYNTNYIAKLIESSYARSNKNWTFIARQESNLILAEYNKTKMLEIGFDKYIWSTAMDERLRESHRVLNGRVFSYNKPPIVDPRTGETANPSEQYNCRCLARPVIE